MKISKEQKELLEDFIAWCEGNTTNALRQGIELAIENYLKYYNSLALGKPEPLAKNKHKHILKSPCCNETLEATNDSEIWCPECLTIYNDFKLT